MRTGQIADAHQKLAHDLPSGKPKRLLEELHPLLLAAGMVRGKPAGERSVGAAEHHDPAGVLDGSVYLQAVANDARIDEEARAVRLTIGRYYLRVEATIRLLKRRPFLEDGEPGETRLVDLQHQPLEEIGIARQWEAVLPVVIRPMPLMARRGIAVCSHEARSYWSRGYWKWAQLITIHSCDELHS